MAQYRVPVLEQYEYQQAVFDKDISTPPVSPVKGDRYIVATGGTGAWAGQDGNIAWYDGAAWKFDVSVAGWQAWVNDEAKQYSYSGTAWLAATHTQGTDQYLDFGGPNQVSAAQTREAYDKRGNFDAALKVILFNL